MNVIILTLLVLILIMGVFIIGTLLNIRRTQSFIKGTQSSIIDTINVLYRSVERSSSENTNKYMTIVSLVKPLITKNNLANETLNKIYNQQKQDYVRIAEETFRLHDRITRMDVKNAKIDLDITDKTPNHVRQSLGLDPIESCDEKYVPGLEKIEDESSDFIRCYDIGDGKTYEIKN